MGSIFSGRQPLQQRVKYEKKIHAFQQTCNLREPLCIHGAPLEKELRERVEVDKYNRQPMQQLSRWQKSKQWTYKTLSNKK